MRQRGLEVDGLAAGYGSRIVIENIDFQIAPGERIAVVGPNGCGKSTLFRAICGIIPMASGTVRIDGVDLEEMSTDARTRRGIGYLLQDRNVFLSLPCEENLRVTWIGGRKGFEAACERVLRVFPLLEPLMQRRAGLLSGGERQALALAMILLVPRSILLLDEPIAGIGMNATSVLLDGLAELWQKEGFASVTVEHRLGQIRKHVDRVLIMSRGRIVYDAEDPSILTDLERLEPYYRL